VVSQTGSGSVQRHTGGGNQLQSLSPRPFHQDMWSAEGLRKKMDLEAGHGGTHL
jgi:hypothetical protein